MELLPYAEDDAGRMIGCSSKGQPSVATSSIICPCCGSSLKAIKRHGEVVGFAHKQRVSCGFVNYLSSTALKLVHTALQEAYQGNRSSYPLIRTGVHLCSKYEGIYGDCCVRDTYRREDDLTAWYPSMIWHEDKIQLSSPDHGDLWITPTRFGFDREIILAPSRPEALETFAQGLEAGKHINIIGLKDSPPKRSAPVVTCPDRLRVMALYESGRLFDTVLPLDKAKDVSKSEGLVEARFYRLPAARKLSTDQLRLLNFVDEHAADQIISCLDCTNNIQMTDDSDDTTVIYCGQFRRLVKSHAAYSCKHYKKNE